MFFALALVCFFDAFSQKHDNDPKLYETLDAAYEFYEKADYLNSVQKANKLLQSAYDHNDKAYQAEAYYLLGLNDETLLEFENAKSKYEKALEIVEIQRDTIFLIDLHNALANIASSQKNYQKAEELYLKGIELIEAKGLKESSKVDFIINLSWTRLDQGKYQEVEPYLAYLKNYLKDHKVNETFDAVVLSDIHYILGRYYGANENLDLAHEHTAQAIEIAKNNDLLEEESQAHKVKSELFEKTEKIDSAFHYLNLHLEHYKEYLDENTLAKLQAEQAKYKVNEYQRALQTSQRENKLMASVADNKTRLNVLYLIVALILAISLLLIYRENQAKKRLINNLHRKNEELQLAKIKVEQAAEARTNFISNISHELRTPLHGVVGITSLLLSEKEISDSNKKLLNSLKFSGDYLLGLISNVLLMSKIDNKKIVNNPKEVAPKEFIKNIKNSVSFSAEKSNVSIAFTIGDEVPEKVKFDESILSEVLINLVENAVKFSKNSNGGGKVEVSLTNRKNDLNDYATLRFSVKDNGVGIPKEKQKEIFEKFSQINFDENTTQGTGIGLSIVKSLLLQLNSDIHLESEVGKGSVFYFDLPCHLISTSVEADDQSIARSNQYYRDKKVLVIEDNKINLMVIERFLSSYNFDLTVIEDGNLGLEAILNNNYDLVLLDINIPSKNGYEIVKEVRKADMTVPVVAVTASELREIEQKAYSSGFTDILIKPFHKDNLFQLIDKYLS